MRVNSSMRGYLYRKNNEKGHSSLPRVLIISNSNNTKKKLHVKR